MKKTLIASLLIIHSMITFSQIETKASVGKGTKIGTTKLIEKASKKEIYVSAYTFDYKIQNQINGKLKIWRKELDITESEFLEITDAGYAYLKSELEKLNFTVLPYDKTAIEESRTYQKLEKKDKPRGVYNGRTELIKNKDINWWKVKTWATGVNTPFLETVDMAGLNYGATYFELGGKDGKLSLIVSGVIDFMEWDSHNWTVGDVLNREVIKPLYGLKLTGQGSQYNFHNATKFGSIFLNGQYESKDISWVTGNRVINEDVDKVEVDKEKFKQTIVALMKAYTDEIIAVIKTSMED